MRKHNSGERSDADVEAANSTVEEAMELFLRQLESGDRPDRSQFLSQFPEIADELEGQLEAIEFLHLATPEIVDQEHDSVTPDTGLSQRATLGDFRLIRPIGRGGMGIVYEAMQLSLHRRVAVKVLPFAAMMDTRQRRRFHNEARAAATLEHPHIVPIHFVGQDRGVHFYAMQLIEGQSLAEVIHGMRVWEDPKLSERAPKVGSAADRVDHANRADTVTYATEISTQRTHSRSSFYRSVAELGRQAADALHYAHQQGVVHRDIKPGNLLLDETGKLWVTDFGLARLESNESITVQGDILGTAAYMSPEQLSGSHLADPRSDIYSLAATLYELITLQQAFDTNGKQTLVTVANREPIALRKTDPQIPLDLATIILTAMSLEPHDRYQSAEEFAKDLQSFVAGNSIQARRPSPIDRLARWTRRHQALASVAVGAVVLLCAVLAASAVWVGRAQQATQQALNESEKHASRVEDLLYLADVQLAYQAWDSGRSEQVSEILDRHLPQHGELDRRGYEWYALDSLSRQPGPTIIGRHEGYANQVAVFPDGRRVASVGDDKKLRIWDLQSSESLAVIEMGDSSAEPLYSVAVSADGKTIATGSDCVQLWDAETGTRKLLLTSFESNVQSIAFSPDGQRIAAASRYDRIRAFNISGELIAEIEDGSRHESMEFTPDSQRLLVPSRRNPERGHKEGFVCVWDSDLSRIESEIEASGPHEKNITHACCVPNSRFYVIAEMSASHPICLVDSRGNNLTLRLEQQGDHVRSIDVSGDGRHLAAGYANGTVAVWNLDRASDGSYSSSLRKRIIRCHDGEITSLKFSANSTLVTSGTDGAVKRLNLPRAANPQLEADKLVSEVKVSPDDQCIAWTSGDIVHFVQTNGARSHREFSNLVPLSFLPDSKLVAVGERNRCEVVVMQMPSGDVTITLPLDSPPEDVAFSPRGDSLAAFDGEGDLTIWNTDTWEKSAELSVDGEKDKRTYRCVYSRDGAFLVCAGEFGEIALIDMANRETVKRVAIVSTINQMVFNHSGTRLATAHNNGSIRIWNWPELTRLGTMTGHEGPVTGLVFAPDGTIASCSDDQTTRLWSIKHLREFGVLDRRAHPASALAVSSDGKLLCTGYNVFDGPDPALAIFRIDWPSKR